MAPHHPLHPHTIRSIDYSSGVKAYRITFWSIIGVLCAAAFFCLVVSLLILKNKILFQRRQDKRYEWLKRRDREIGAQQQGIAAMESLPAYGSQGGMRGQYEGEIRVCGIWWELSRKRSLM
jgi:hypothetical protein